MSKSFGVAFLVAMFLCSVSSNQVNAQKFKKSSDSKKSKFVKSGKSNQALGPGTVALPNGLQYKELKIGKGPSPRPGQRIKIHFRQTLYPKGTELLDTYKMKVPFKCKLGSTQLIKGLNIGIATMKVGGKREILVPPELGYGKKRLNYKTPPNSTLKYVVELLAVN